MEKGIDERGEGRTYEKLVVLFYQKPLLLLPPVYCGGRLFPNRSLRSHISLHPPVMSHSVCVQA